MGNYEKKKDYETSESKTLTPCPRIPHWPHSADYPTEYPHGTP